MDPVKKLKLHANHCIHTSIYQKGKIVFFINPKSGLILYGVFDPKGFLSQNWPLIY